ncbi:unannotated protein [freshwater metagenome]|uniref:Unannotated protein n=1 Tax=freshwater metagenome TaxID=449393 RepID=A0A6J7QCD6_9ZZZZ
MANTGLCHYGNTYGIHNGVDHVGIRHARHPTLCANIGRDPLKSHYSYSAGILGNLGLFYVDDIHNDAALEHVGHPTLDSAGTSHCLLVAHDALSTSAEVTT